jgi:hypothetical protein
VQQKLASFKAEACWVIFRIGTFGRNYVPYNVQANIDFWLLTPNIAVVASAIASIRRVNHEIAYFSSSELIVII